MGNIVQGIRSVLFTVQMYIMMPIFGLVLLPYALLSPNGARFTCKAYSRWVFWTASWMVGIKCEFRGTPPEGEALIASKHQSFLDIMMVFTGLPRAKFIMKKSVLWMPVIGQYAKMLDCVPVERGKRGAAIKKMVEDVEAGHEEAGQLIIYSQGTRIAPGVKAPYKIGTGVLYEELGQVCVPVATNVGVLWPKHGLMRKPGVAVVEYMDPIAPGMDRDAFMAKIEEVVEKRSNELMVEAGFDPDALR
jgi:1-acyl-sn-glycerol-3-phosphate acyltransferase